MVGIVVSFYLLALGTYPFYYVIHAAHSEAFGKLHVRNVCLFKAESTLATLAIEMRVQRIMYVAVAAVAVLIFQ